jgi:hypothetical protein
MPAAFVIAARQLAESPAVALHVDWCQARLMSACPPIAAHYRTSPEVATVAVPVTGCRPIGNANLR